jgi:hypothetical protein
VAGAAFVGDIERMLTEAGFVDVRVTPKDASREMVREWMPGTRAENYVLSATIEASKP